MEHGGKDARLHPDKLIARGFDREPEPRARPSDSNAAKYRGEITQKWQEVLEHRVAHAPMREAEQAQAREYWTHRKHELGLSPTMSMTESLGLIRAARTRAIAQQPARDPVRVLSLHEQALTEKVQGLEKYVQRLQVEQSLERIYTARGQPRSVAGQGQVERLLAEGHERHGLPRERTERTPSTRRADAIRQQLHERQPTQPRRSPAAHKAVSRIVEHIMDDSPEHDGVRVRLHD